MFNIGILELEDKAKVESLYWEISQAVVRILATARWCRRRFGSWTKTCQTSTSATSPCSSH